MHNFMTEEGNIKDDITMELTIERRWKTKRLDELNLCQNVSGKNLPLISDFHYYISIENRNRQKWFIRNLIFCWE